MRYPWLDPGQVRELATARFVADGEAVLLPGPPGVGEMDLLPESGGVRSERHAAAGMTIASMSALASAGVR